MPRLSQLPSLTVPDNSDELVINDVSSATSKRITRGDLLKGTPLPDDSVSTAAIQDGAVKVANIDFSWQNPVVDANGWTIEDMGKHKIATKRYSPTMAALGATSSAAIQSGINKPVDLPTNYSFFWSARPTSDVAERLFSIDRNRAIVYCRNIVGYSLSSTTVDIDLKYEWSS